MTSQIPTLACPYLREMWAILSVRGGGNVAEASAAMMSDMLVLEHRAITESASADSLAILSMVRRLAATEAWAHWPSRISGH